jgi:hypothetical protein
VFDDRQLGLPPSAGIRHLRAFSASRTAGNVAPVSALALIILAAPDESFARDGINPHRIIDNRRVGWLLGMMADHRDGLGRCNVVTRSPAGFVGNGSIEVPSATSFLRESFVSSAPGEIGGPAKRLAATWQRPLVRLDPSLCESFFGHAFEPMLV